MAEDTADDRTQETRVDSHASPHQDADLALLLTDLARLVTERIETALRDAGYDYVRPDHRALLEAVHTYGTLPRAADAMNTPGAVVREVATRLGGRRDYVRRTDHQRARLTERGRGALALMQAETRTIEDELRASLGPLVLDGLLSVLHQGAAALHQH